MTFHASVQGPEDGGPEDGLDIVVEHSDRERVDVTVRGEIDLLTCDPFEKALSTFADGRRVSLDLGDVPYMDSTGLRALLNAERLLDRSGGRLLITRLSAPTQRLFELAGLRDRFA